VGSYCSVSEKSRSRAIVGRHRARSADVSLLRRWSSTLKAYTSYAPSIGFARSVFALVGLLVTLTAPRLVWKLVVFARE
jgi:hypothetical protein